MKPKTKVLITGGCGFIGSHLVDAYLTKNYSVIVIDNLSNGVRENSNPQAKYYYTDLSSKETQKIILSEKPDIINHHAAQIDVFESLKNPAKYVDRDILGFIKLLDISRDVHIKKFIFASSGGAIYEEKSAIINENDRIRPISPYGIVKYTSELFLNFYKNIYDLDYVALRYSNVYGPRQGGKVLKGIIPIIIQNTLSDKPTVLFNSGKQSRDFIYIKDVIEANLLATSSPFCGSLNISSNTSTQIRDLYNLIQFKMKALSTPTFIKSHKIDVNYSNLGNTLAKKILNWNNKTDLNQGLSETIAWFQKNKNVK